MLVDPGRSRDGVDRRLRAARGAERGFVWSVAPFAIRLGDFFDRVAARRTEASLSQPIASNARDRIDQIEEHVPPSRESRTHLNFTNLRQTGVAPAAVQSLKVSSKCASDSVKTPPQAQATRAAGRGASIEKPHFQQERRTTGRGAGDRRGWIRWRDNRRKNSWASSIAITISAVIGRDFRGSARPGG